MRDAILIGLVIALSACGGEEPTVRGVGTEGQATAEGVACEHEEHAAPLPTGPQPSAVLADGSRQFGGALTDLAPTALSAISASPTTFDGQTVRTEGTIERVCQRMGCWMELRAEGTEPIRVPMAGHSFFVPKTASGRKARVLATLVKNDEDGACAEDKDGLSAAGAAPAGEKHAKGKGCKAEAEAQLGRPLAKMELIAEGVELM